MVLGDLASYRQKNETRPPTYTIHKNKLKMDKRLKYKSWHHKSARGKHRQYISDIPQSSTFADISLRARNIKERINKWDYVKLKSFCTAKETIIKIKMEPTVWENIFAMIHRTRFKSQKYIKNLNDSAPRRQIIQLQNGQRI